MEIQIFLQAVAIFGLGLATYGLSDGPISKIISAFFSIAGIGVAIFAIILKIS